MAAENKKCIVVCGEEETAIHRFTNGGFTALIRARVDALKSRIDRTRRTRRGLVDFVGDISSSFLELQNNPM